ncbi:MAG: dipicolinate synthase subunit DpsA [Firmicutes bacterium]|jgi:dipicolinate synthase subunit A|nr:dipicolinate synthase subunit DpsA [Bacillota bacterium]
MCDLAGLNLCVLGGDLREVELVRALVDHGALVRSFGAPREGMPEGVVLAPSPDEAARGADALILPLSGTDKEGNVRVSREPVRLTREILASLNRGAVVFAGSVCPSVAHECESLGITVVKTGENDELAILNSIPSAEGAILMAIQATPITIHGSNCMVLGMGRTGMTLARMLLGIGATVWAVARKPKDRARAFEMGFIPLDFPDLPGAIKDMDIVFNTVPHMVLDRTLIAVMKKTAAIIDLASAPGGTDFASARELGIHAELAPGLPGKVAPLTAGKILARVVPALIAEAFAARE